MNYHNKGARQQLEIPTPPQPTEAEIRAFFHGMEHAAEIAEKQKQGGKSRIGEAIRKELETLRLHHKYPPGSAPYKGPVMPSMREVVPAAILSLTIIAIFWSVQ
ncbi:MAG: hypothetical protein JWO78_169 [Micavibrio sp.]|nr:hypothetical protein [Micavibrio sp.]